MNSLAESLLRRESVLHDLRSNPIDVVCSAPIPTPRAQDTFRRLEAGKADARQTKELAPEVRSTLQHVKSLKTSSSAGNRAPPPGLSRRRVRNPLCTCLSRDGDAISVSRFVRPNGRNACRHRMTLAKPDGRAISAIDWSKNPAGLIRRARSTNASRCRVSARRAAEWEVFAAPVTG